MLRRHRVRTRPTRILTTDLPIRSRRCQWQSGTVAALLGDAIFRTGPRAAFQKDGWFGRTYDAPMPEPEVAPMVNAPTTPAASGQDPGSKPPRMEDVATAEISRAQVWSWVKTGRFTRERVREELARVEAADDAKELFTEVALSEKFVEFLTR